MLNLAVPRPIFSQNETKINPLTSLYKLN